ncbi:Cyclin pch1 [Wickerhamiella sorbophila]|uniref:Cyclin pch1 n=1 Tax=Wickerhamiella sorbophila TaxID=45607 RepID=A0A2T0FHW5_9ASCO|nr:Cyclin pch1 [Wickerhamiella sorbophila]PRT54593.1 Cyclin pch1 [Wickerhamiella sorbophila]
MDKLKRKPRWTLPLEDVKKNSPSARDGVSYEEQLIKQSKGVSFVIQTSSQLKLRPAAIYTAATYLHRFYTRYSLKRVHYYDCASACVFLASKTEESPRTIQEVAFMCMRVALKNPRLKVDTNSREFKKWVETIMYTEELLLEGLFFDLTIESPYRSLAAFTTKYPTPGEGINTLANNFVNDSCRTMLSVVYSSDKIAAAAYYWAIKRGAASAPLVDGEKWYTKAGYNRSLLIDVVNEMTSMFNAIKADSDPAVYLTMAK